MDEHATEQSPMARTHLVFVFSIVVAHALATMIRLDDGPFDQVFLGAAIISDPDPKMAELLSVVVELGVVLTGIAILATGIAVGAVRAGITENKIVRGIANRWWWNFGYLFAPWFVAWLFGMPIPGLP